MSSLTGRDADQLASFEISIEEAERQLALLRSPGPAFVLDRPCVLGNGVRRLSPEAEELAEGFYSRAVELGRVSKFVPASGAATRMFQTLDSLLEETPFPSTDRLAERVTEGDEPALAWARLSAKWHSFPWAATWASRGLPSPSNTNPQDLLTALLRGSEGLANQPKGLVPFHRRGDSYKTAFEEHIAEGLNYLDGGAHPSKFHFTVAAEHRSQFEEAADQLQESLRQRGTELEITFSLQSPSTQTLSVDPHGEPFRHNDGALLLRPGGHGSLLLNLDQLRADLLLIKNIDNVRQPEAHAEVARWQRVLGGTALELRQEVDRHLVALRDDSSADAEESARRFLRQRLGLDPPEASTREHLVTQLDRPLRVCGVVLNRGEPGGGPFWVRSAAGQLSRQIVESAEVGKDPEQRHIFESSTHFNPVLLACLVRDSEGQPYDLSEYVDQEAVFVADKSHGGLPLRALERPGLWNGSMSNWSTIFIEVPSSTFAPVKTVFDLLRPEHQPS